MRPRPCPGDEIGRRSGLKIRIRKEYGFDSRPGHHQEIRSLGRRLHGPRFGLFRFVASSFTSIRSDPLASFEDLRGPLIDAQPSIAPDPTEPFFRVRGAAFLSDRALVPRLLGLIESRHKLPSLQHW